MRKPWSGPALYERRWRRVYLAIRLAYAALRGRGVAITVQAGDGVREFWGIPR